MERTTTMDVEIALGKDGQYEEDLDSDARALLRELSELDIEDVRLDSEGTVPAGAKGVDLVTIGTLALAVLPIALPKIIDFLNHWCSRGDGRTLKIKIVHEARSVEIELPLIGRTNPDLDSIVKLAKGAVEL